MLELALNLLLACLLLLAPLITLALAAAGLLRLERHENALRWGGLGRRALPNLPGVLLSGQMKAYCVHGRDEQSGLVRVYTVQAKHAGAAQMKAQGWGLLIGRISEQPPGNRQTTTN